MTTPRRGSRGRDTATHTGALMVFEGDTRQDTMGFTVTGPDEFVGSGHPDLRDDLPPLLGLIRSDDGGRSWNSISLLGEADFHVLRTAGTRIYGVNATDGTLRISDDGGRTWATRTPPAALLDLAPAPGRADELLASGESGLFVSRDAGETWRPTDRSRAGLLAWPEGDALYLVDGAGHVHRSRDRGGTWSAQGEIGGRPAAFVSERSVLYVALHTNEVKTSSDDGRTWRSRVLP